MQKEFQLFFKHLFHYPEWKQEPFMPWKFESGVLFSTLQFFESDVVLQTDFSLRKQMDCQVFMDSGAFSASASGFRLDPYEVCEMQAVLKADLAVPLDRVITYDDSQATKQAKINQTVANTELLMEFIPKSNIIAPLQGLDKNTLEYMFDRYRELGLTKFALGGVVFEKNLSKAIARIELARDITKGYFLHVFGRFLHPNLLKLLITTQVDSVDGFGYVLSSIKGKYVDIDKRCYKSVIKLSSEDLERCNCNACRGDGDEKLHDFQRGDTESQYLLIRHNIEALITIKDQILEEIRRS